MFRKPFNLKSNAAMRNSDKRKIINRLNLNQMWTSLLLKMQVSVMRVTNFQGISLNIYVFDREPLLFEYDSAVFPTLYLSWKIPRLFPAIFIGEQVMGFLENGADLMLPGVIVLDEVPFSFAKNDVVVIASITRDHKIRGPLAIGVALMSSESALASGMKGRGVEILHVFKDHLWEVGSQVQPVVTSFEEWLKPQETGTDPTLEHENEEAKPFEMSSLAEFCKQTDGEEKFFDHDPKEHMEEMLTRTFFAALKYKVQEDNNFPYDSGNFYAAFILKFLPTHEKIDLKKTKFKKFNNFLQEINKNEHGPILEISTKKGIDLIQKINWNHPYIQNAEPLEVDQAEDTSKSLKIRVAECYSVTEAALDILKSSGASYRKGDIIQTNDLRDALQAYAKKKNLERDGNRIELDDPLQTVIKHFTPVTLPLNDFLQRFSTLLTKAFVIHTLDGKKIIRRLQIPQVSFQVEKRSGNKVVTLVNNLSVFGIDPKSMSTQVQNGAATGATLISTAANCEGSQLLINGNHVNYVGALLMEEYGLNKKYIKGLELGVKQKKSKK